MQNHHYTVERAVSRNVALAIGLILLALPVAFFLAGVVL